MKLGKISVIAGLLLLVFGILQLSQSHEIYFFTTGKERVNFETANGRFDDTKTIAYYNGNLLQVPQSTQTDLAFQTVLGEASVAQKRIEVDLTNQRVYAYEGNNKVYDFLVSTGKWGATPTGNFTIWIKLRYTRMSGGNQALGTYYNLPNVPYTMFFYNESVPKWKGFSLHGTYWHSNFGHPMSHGCVNMKTEEVEKIFYWANPELSGKSSIQATADNPGTPVIIYGTTPNS